MKLIASVGIIAQYQIMISIRINIHTVSLKKSGLRLENRMLRNSTLPLQKENTFLKRQKRVQKILLFLLFFGQINAALVSKISCIIL